MPVEYEIISGNEEGLFQLLEGKVVPTVDLLDRLGTYELVVRAVQETAITINVDPWQRLPLFARVIAYGDSNYQGSYCTSMFTHAIQYARGKVIVPRFGNAAVAGYTTTSCINNWASRVGSLTADIMTFNVGRNNIYSISDAASKASVVATMQAEILTLWQMAFDKGIKRVLHNTFFPRVTNWNEFMEEARLEMNAWLRAHHLSFDGRVRICDLDPAGFDPVADTVEDRQHVNNSGAGKFAPIIGRQLAIAVDGINGFYSDPADFGSIVSAGSRALAGNTGTMDGGVTGEVATGCDLRIAAGLTGATVVASKEVDDEGINIQRFDISGVAEDVGTVRFMVPCTGTYSAGARNHGYMRCKMSGVRNIAYARGGMYIGTPANPTSAHNAGYSSDTLRDIDEADLCLMAEVANQPSASSALKVGAVFRFGPGEVAGTFRLSRPSAVTGIVYP